MNQKISVLFLCGWFPSKVSPYNGDFIQRHAEAVALMHDVSVIHIITDSSQKEQITYTFNSINNVNTHIAFIKPTQNPILKLLLFLKAFRVLIKKVSNFQIVHLNEVFPLGVFSLYLKWLKKTPYIISEHWTGYHYPNSKSISIYQKIISKIITKKASYICPVSNDLANSMRNLGLKGNYKNVPNVVDTNLFIPQKNLDDIFTITHISNMNNDHKNIKGLLKVIAKVQEKIEKFRVQIIGENSYQYKDYASKLGINNNTIAFYDQITHKEVSEKLKNSNLFILFSNYENLPCVILEAFSCGIPVISTNVGGISEYFPNDFGKLITVNNQEKLTTHIINCYQNKYTFASKEQMHNYAKSLFSKETIASNFSELYTKSLHQ